MKDYKILDVPSDGKAITMEGEGVLRVPDNPVVPFIEGDGTGPDIWRAAKSVFDAAVNKAYGKERAIRWMEVFAGEKSFNRFGEWLPGDTLDAFRDFLVGIKGPLTTPIGGGFRSLNVSLRQILDLYVCLRPVKYIKGVPSPVRRPELVDMVVFRENSEDIYAGIEWVAQSPEARKVISFLQQEMGVSQIRFPETTAIGVKPVSMEGSERLIEAAIRYGLKHGRKSVTFAHKGNVMKYTEGAFAKWGYQLAARKFRDETVSQRESWIIDNKDRNPEMSVEENARAIDPGYDMMSPAQQENIRREVEGALELMPTHGGGRWREKLLLKDVIADIVFQQTITRADEFDIIATLNLNGDYLSDALAAQVGGMGIAPGANINYLTGHAIFEATHGTAPKYANLDKVNPSSVILSGIMMFEYMGWNEAADLIGRGIEAAISDRIVTYDFARLMRADGMEKVREVKCSEFGRALVERM